MKHTMLVLAKHVHLDCSEDLIHSMHELLAGIESTEMQDVNVHEHLAEHVFNIFKE